MSGRGYPTMSEFFRWNANQEVADFVFANYTEVGASDLSVKVATRFGIHLQPASIRSYVRHRKTREYLAKEGISTENLPEPAAEVPEPGDRRPDQRKPATWEQIEEMFDGATAEIERKEAHRLAQTNLTVNFADSKMPVGVAYWGDWQVGANGVMMEKLKHDARTIRDTDGLNVFVMGDLIQNLNKLKHPESLHECILPDPREQSLCAKLILNIAREKIQGMVDGNHERNTKQSAGFVPTEEWCKEFGFPYLWYGAKIAYTVGEVTYTMGLQHRFRGESGINTTNAQRRMYQEWYPADIEVMGDRHYNDLQKRPMPLGDTVWLRSGSYQKWDDYGQFAGGYKGSWGIPVVILYPDRKRVVPFYGSDFEVALEFLADQRARYLKKLSKK